MELLQVVWFTIELVIRMVFPIWFVVILGPLVRWRKNVLPGMLAFWGLLAAGRLLLIFGEPLTSYFIPEPVNTIAFILTGALLVVFSLVKKSFDRKKLHRAVNQAKQPQDILDVSPTQFEKMVAEMFNLLGHKARRVGHSGDHGIDVVVDAKNGEKWVVQCKRWRGTIGEPELRDFYGAMHHEKADKGMFVTTGKFTQQARDWSKGKPMELLDGDGFLKTWKKIKAVSTK